MPQHNRGKKGKRPDDRPARKRYWNGKALERNKSRRVAKNTGEEVAEAVQLWRESRGKRRMKP